MELNWSTFILEIINFLILVWLLKHFFYKPVMDIITRRKQTIQDSLDKADAVRVESESLKSQYENRLEDWEKEKAKARVDLHREIEAERKQAMDNLAQSIQQEKEKSKVLIQRQQDNAAQKNKMLAIEQSLAFSTHLLSRLANQNLESAIIRLVLEDLENLSSGQRAELQKACTGTKEPVHISSAYVIDEVTRVAIKDALSKILKQSVEAEFKQDPSLLAGLLIDIGSWNLQASLQEELKYFGDMNHDH